MNRATIRFYWGTYCLVLFKFFLVPNLHVFFKGHVSFIIKQVFCVFEKIYISGLSWDITIQDRRTNLWLKSDITLQSAAKRRRPVWVFSIDFLILVPGLTKFIWCCRLSLNRRNRKFLRLSEKAAEMNHGHKWIFPAEGQPYKD